MTGLDPRLSYAAISQSHGAARVSGFPNMGDFAGLMVPRPPHTDGPPHAERVLAWTLIIDSGHIPLRTVLGSCNRDLYRPLRRRLLMWVKRTIFQESLQSLVNPPGEQRISH